MIETNESLDLSEEGFADRSSSPDGSEDDHSMQVSDSASSKAASSVMGGPHLQLADKAGTSGSLINAASYSSLQDITEMTLKEELNANSLLDSDYKDVKVGFEELCPVCGDKVSGYHYGLLTCESCKGFFKRTVQNKKVYSCVDNRSCQIDKSQRKRCPYCRFQKCLSVGMKLEAVRSDRMRGGRNKFGPMYKRDRALKQQAARQAQSTMGSCDDLPLLVNGMMPGVSPGSPEDIKPDPVMLQASLNLYTGGIPASSTSSVSLGMIPGLKSLSVSVPCSTSAVSAGSAASCSPPTPQRHHSHHHHHHPVPSSHHHHHQSPSHHSLVPSSPSPQSFQQNFGHVTLTVPQPCSPRSQYLPHYNHTSGQLQAPQHPQPQYAANSFMEHGDSSPAVHQHQQPPHPLHISGHSPTGVAGFQTSQNQTFAKNNSGQGLAAHEKEPSFPATQVHPKVVEALRSLQAPTVMGLSEGSILPALITEIKSSMVDETEIRHKMVTFMQGELSQTDITSCPERFLPILCQVVDQLLFLMVEWARNSSFFKEIKVEDQMKLLHNSWSEILILDFIYRQISHVWGKDFITQNGEMIGFEILDKLGLADVKTKMFELIKKGRELKIDYNEYMCLKFLIMLNPDASSLENRAFIEQSQEKINAALFEYCLMVYPEMVDRFSQLLMRLPEIRLISIRIEDFLYFKHLSSEVPDQTLLTEMLHAKRRG